MIGTHGRSIYKTDISSLQKIDAQIMGDALTVFEVENIKHSKNWGNAWSSWMKPNTPGLDVHFYTNNGGRFNASIQTANGVEVASTTVESDNGLNILSHDLAFSKKGKSDFLKKNKMKLETAKNGKTYLPKGDYIVEISGNGQQKKIEFKVE